MSLPPAGQPFHDEEEDRKRRAAIEEMMRSQREHYFRNEPVQQEYRDILDREEARGETTRGPSQFELALADFWKRKAEAPANPAGADAEETNAGQDRPTDEAVYLEPDAATPQPPRVAQQSATQETVGQSRGDRDALERKIDALTAPPEKQAERLTIDGYKKHPGEIAIEKLPEINRIIEEEAKWWGVNPRWLKIVAFLESSGNLRKQNKGSSFRGLFQFDTETGRSWDVYGGRQNDIDDPGNSTRAAIRAFREHRQQFMARYEREPTLAEMYLMHQQGRAGTFLHMKNPSGLAWKNLFNGGLGIPEEKAKSRIRDNLPDHLKPRADSVTSQEFMDVWRKKVEGGEGNANFSRSETYTAKPRTPREPAARWFSDQDGIRDILLRYGRRPDNKR